MPPKFILPLACPGIVMANYQEIADLPKVTLRERYSNGRNSRSSSSIELIELTTLTQID
ncbi:hypothetical protein [Chamaesiphon sp. OTE_20_metabat_361]|uniref:hypothetical protein n=1 Tax=Chamaesiphon sp. OTE_20_metabat_361 TaxID=2964689 RepID=UPI00286A0660|nr:hypothetical protein [Chamaesiphon sp. OTE_20_metabat_361]